MSQFENMYPYRDSSESKDEGSFTMEHCPVKEKAKIALKSSNETRKAIQRLRETLLNCGVCSLYHQCELQEDFNLQIDLVIAEINEEWGW